MDTDETTELMLSTTDVGKRLKVGNAMVRKWALAYEAATGDKVKLKSKRDGREFTSSQVDIISRAKSVVDSEGVKVETALRSVLGLSDAVLLAPQNIDTTDATELLREYLARTDETNQLLLEEIRGLRQDLQARELSAVPSPVRDSPSKSEERSYTLLQRFVKRVFGV